MRTLLTAVAAVIFAGVAQAQSYPEKPVRLVVGFSAGGPTDLPARFIAERLGAALVLGNLLIIAPKIRPGRGLLLGRSKPA